MISSMPRTKARSKHTCQYIVEFPEYSRTEMNYSASRIFISRYPGSHRYNVTSVHVPADVESLIRCIAVIEGTDLGSNWGRIVEDLLELGCGVNDSTEIPKPVILSQGEKLIHVMMSPRLTGQDSTAIGGQVTKDFNALQPVQSILIPLTVAPTSHRQGIPIHRAVDSPNSTFDTPTSFMSSNSPASFVTARSSHASPAYAYTYGLSPDASIVPIREDEICDPRIPAPYLKLRNNYYARLHEQAIIQPLDKELNWSGKGQHVTFLPKDPVPLDVLSHLGASMTALVDKVLCRRIVLARKTMRCSRDWPIREALGEVYHLQNFRHRHIVQLVGSYLQGRDFSILMYPVADYHLGTFLEDTADKGLGELSKSGTTDYTGRMLFLVHSLACLTSAVAYVHDHTTKHMDIKPQNILVRMVKLGEFRVYLADFGLSRSFEPQGNSQTDGPISRTPRYCAPEVFQCELRGRSADIFSLGCVLSEIMTVVCHKHPHDFTDYRKGEGDDESFHANLEKTNDWLDELAKSLSLVAIHREGKRMLSRNMIPRDVCAFDIVKKTLSYDPAERPTARDIQRETSFMHGRFCFTPRSCCELPPEPYVAYNPASCF